MADVPPLTSAGLPVPPWRRSPSRPARQQLTASVIVDAAMRVLDAEGLDAVSMRRVAQELGTGAASLYQHVRNKRDLHELMLDVALGDIETPEPDPERWQQQLKDILMTLSHALRRRRGIARIAMETLIPTTPSLLVSMDAMMGLLRAGGVPDRLVATACDVLALYVTAHAYEASLWPTGAAGEEASRRLDEIQQYLADLPADRLPHLVALQAQSPQGDAESNFEFGLDVLIAGLAAYAGRR